MKSMATIIPTSQTTTGVEAYEDMFKEITRKLYGDETGHGLHTLGTPIAHVATSGPTAPEGGERSFTTLMTDRSLIEYEQNGSESNNQFKTEDHLTTAFGLAALMQNGFPPPGTILNPHNFVTNNITTINKPNTTITIPIDERWQNTNNNNNNINNNNNNNNGNNTNVNGNGNNETDCLPWNTTKLMYTSTPNKTLPQFKPLKREIIIPDASSPNNSSNSLNNQQLDQKINIIIPNTGNSNNNINISSNNINQTTNTLTNIITNNIATNIANNIANNISNNIANTIINNNIININNNNNNNNNQNATTNSTNQIIQITKRYNCSNCPYSTDRRDLFTRHENIHKDEKPFHCYVCTKQFNRADHVKKHFLRMHRELAYDINKTRRNQPHSKNSNNVSSSTINTNTVASTIASSIASVASIITTPSSSVVASFFQNQPTTITIPTTNFQLQQNSNLNNNNNNNNGNNNNSSNNNGIIVNNNNTNNNQTTVNNTMNNNGSANPNNLMIVTQTNQDGNNLNNSTDLLPAIHQIKVEKPDKPVKKKGEKRFICCYCPWSGADSWGLKRHLNTHTKPYVCMLCDYKAARSERLATHVFKVHNKKACNKCNFLADDQIQFAAHQAEAHPHDSIRPPRSSGGSNVLRTIGNSFIQNNQLTNIQNNIIATTANQILFGTINTISSTNAGGSGTPNTNIITSNNNSTNNNISNTNNNNNINNNNNNNINNTNTNNISNNNTNNNNNTNIIFNTTSILSDVGNNQQNWTNNRNNGNSGSGTQKKRGAERLFQYMEADGSDPEDYSRQMRMVALSRNTASVAQDFHNAGDGYTKKAINYNKQQNNNNYTNINNNYNTSNINGYSNHYKHNLIPNLNMEIDNKDHVYQQIITGSVNNLLLYQNHNNFLHFNGTNNNCINYNSNTNSNSSPANDNINRNETNLTTTSITTNSATSSLLSTSQPPSNITTTSPTNSLSIVSILNNTKKRRKSSHDKENTNFKLKKQIALNSSYDLNGLEKHMKDVITKFYFDPVTSTGKQQRSTSIENDPKSAFDNISSIQDYLKNNKELTISIEPKSKETHNKVNSEINKVTITKENTTNVLKSDNDKRISTPLIVEKRNRKQAQPRKIVEIQVDDDEDDCRIVENINNLTITNHNNHPIKNVPKLIQTDSIRDKHLIRLVSRKKFCKICKLSNSVQMPYHTKTTLILHTIWRHSIKRFRCAICKEKFSQKYKLYLHKHLKHNNNNNFIDKKKKKC